jgi:hypothetical protein
MHVVDCFSTADNEVLYLDTYDCTIFHVIWSMSQIHLGLMPLLALSTFDLEYEKKQVGVQ